MKTVFREKRITGILGVLPQNISFFDDEIDNYTLPKKQTLRLKKLMGFEKHRLAKEKSTASDFCVYGLEHLIKTKKIKKEQIGALVVVTLSPDYYVPHISNIIHGKCGLDSEVVCIDIAQGCCGYLYGLMQAFMLLDLIKNKKVLLFNTDVLCHKVSKEDRNCFPLMGDATTISVIENDYDAKESIPFELYVDGNKRDSIIIPAGGFAMPATSETSKMVQFPDGNRRSLENFQMEGTEVFNFVQTKIPPLVDSMLQNSQLTVENIDYFFMHQPNRFMLEKLADKMGLPYEKVFMNVVENYGNPSGASIPINIIHNMSDEMIKGEYRCCLLGFGSGLSWGALIMRLGNMDFCEMIETQY